MASLVGLRSALAAQVLFRSLLLVGCFLMMSAVPVAAQEVVTNETVIRMVRAGLSEGGILAKIRSSKTQFDTRTDALIALKQAGVPEKVMAAILGEGAPPAQAAAPPAASASSGDVAMIPPAAAPRGETSFPVHQGQAVELIAAGGEIQTSRMPYNRKSSSRTPYAGSTSQRGIRSEDRIDQRGFFWIRPRAPLAPGEYGFVLTRSSGTTPSGTVYDFGVD